MNIYTHFFVPFVISFVLSKFGIFSLPEAFICGFVGVMIDIDHYLVYFFNAKKDRFSLKKAWNNSMKHKHFLQRSFLHFTRGLFIVTLILIGVLMISWKWALLLSIAFYSHYLLDRLIFTNSKAIRWKLFGFYMKDTYFEIILDLVLLGVLVSFL